MTCVKYEGEKLISIDSQSVHVLAESVADKLAKKNISPSMVTGLEGCAGRWLSDSFVMRDLIEQEPDNAARRGSLFHKVMEDLFSLPPEERTHDAVKRFVKQNLEEGEFADLGNNKEAIMWLRTAINGYYKMGGDPTKVKVAQLDRTHTKKDGTSYQKSEPGLEIFVRGQIGEAKRPTLGYIDQVIEDPTRDDSSIIIQDWKSGAKAKKWNPKTKGDEGLAEQRQQIIYSILLRQEGFNVSGARLVFPVAQEIVDVDLGDEKLYADVIKAVEDTDKKLDVMIESNDFELKPSFLCAWCPLAKICPQAMIKPYDKMMAAYSQQPEPEVLLQAIELL